MSRNNFRIIALVACLFAVSGTAAEGKEKAHSSKKPRAGRSLASVSPIDASMGQGEQMLHQSPGSDAGKVSRSKPASAPIALSGVCRDSYGVSHNSGDKGYTSCIEASTRTSSGASTNDYFGKAQNQAGVAVRIGN